MNDTGKLILRLALGTLILLHGVSKLRSGIDGISSMVSAAGLPAYVAYGVYIGEVLAPLMVLAGWFSRIGAGIIAINMLVAVWLVHLGDMLSFAESGGWALELQAMFLMTALAITCLGPGRFSVNRR